MKNKNFFLGLFILSLLLFSCWDDDGFEPLTVNPRIATLTIYPSPNGPIDENIIFNYNYDSQNRLISLVSNSTFPDIINNIMYTYDNNVLTKTETFRNTTQNNSRLEYFYDANHKLSKISIYSYNVDNPGDGWFHAGNLYYTYDSNGKIQNIIYGYSPTNYIAKTSYGWTGENITYKAVHNGNGGLMNEVELTYYTTINTFKQLDHNYYINNLEISRIYVIPEIEYGFSNNLMKTTKTPGSTFLFKERSYTYDSNGWVTAIYPNNNTSGTPIISFTYE